LTGSGQSSNANLATVRTRLLRWSRYHGRDYPWRHAALYGVVVAEVLLQKTRADAVMVLRRWPDADSLLRARPQTIQRLVAPLGLGEQRTQRLRAAVRWDVGQTNAPSGIGPYGQGVVALTTGTQPARAPVDGNIARVLTRLSGYTWSRGEPRKQPEIRNDISTLIDGPSERGLRVLYALVDLGALICTPRNPQCTDCPLERQCASAP